MAEKIERDEKKGIKRPVRAMIVGITNVGKSTFINTLAKNRRAKAEDRPGVTRKNQWFTVPELGIELLDTPGVLWPKFDDPEVGRKLAFTGAVKDAVVDIESLCLDLLGYMSRYYPERLCERYKLDSVEGMSPLEVMELIAKKRGMIMRGGEIDYERVSVMVMDEYRGGKLGRITLEMPEK